MAVMFQNEMREYARPAGKSEVKEYAPKQKRKKLKEYLTKAQLVKDIPFANNDGKELLLDLYLPKTTSKEKRPGMVVIHGGGWRTGTKQNSGSIAAEYANNGYVAISINYRLVAEAKFPANIQDCKAAVRWLRANAKKYNIDTHKIAATGPSAGGHLAALVATSAGVKEFEGNGGNAEFSSTIQAAVPTGAQTNFLSPRIIEMSEEKNDKMLYPNLLGGPYSTHAGMYKLASPITHLDKSDPPMLFISGEKDNTDTHAVLFREKASQLGVVTNYKMLYRAPHGYNVYQGWFDDSMRASLNFLKIHLDLK